MRMKRGIFALVLICGLSLALTALSTPLSFVEAPDVLRPGKFYNIKINTPTPGSATMQLLAQGGQTAYTLFSDYQVLEGENTLRWDGRSIEHTIIEQGEYALRVSLADGTAIDTPLRIGAPYPMLMEIQQSDAVVSDAPVTILFSASEAGTLSVALEPYGSDVRQPLFSQEVAAGQGSFDWNGELNGARAKGGSYALVLTLTALGGMQSMEEYVYISVGTEETQEEEIEPASEISDELPGDDAPEEEEAPEPEPDVPGISAPYSDVNDGSYWSMTPGELDDATIWNIMMQPITVYNDGKIGGAGHVYLMENPDGTGAQVAQIHGLSQGLHVLGEPNEHGYVLAETFSNYDRKYSPETEDEKARAFELKRGYIKASGLRQIDVKTDMALLIDKLTQRMYLFKDGVRVTELLISTGTYEGDDLLFETPPGEFITVEHTGTLVDGYMESSMAIRINGGVLVHEVPHQVQADGTYTYAKYEPYLGQKQSHGCVRVQRKKNEEGYNQRWIWDNFKKGAPYKVIIWDDLNRADAPTVWRPNP